MIGYKREYNTVEICLPVFIVIAYLGTRRRSPRNVRAATRPEPCPGVCLIVGFAKSITKTREAKPTADTDFGFRIAH